MQRHDRSYEQAQYDELACYTLTLGDADFIHQNVVDAHTAQWATPGDKPIAAIFGLIGLYLSVECGLTGRAVQRAHMALAKNRKEWPKFPMPVDRGVVWASDVLARPPGPERSRAIADWCRSVWAAYADNHAMIDAMVRAAFP